MLVLGPTTGRRDVTAVREVWWSSDRHMIEGAVITTIEV